MQIISYHVKLLALDFYHYEIDKDVKKKKFRHPLLCAPISIYLDIFFYLNSTDSWHEVDAKKKKNVWKS